MDTKNINENIKTMNKGLLVHANCLSVLRTMHSNVTDLIVTDPPYGYSFMGKNWDKALPDIEIFRECLRVLKPGAFAFVMAAPRQDVLSRMMIKLEDAGFKTDFTSIYWTYASGFPKAQNIGKKHKELKGAYGGFQPKPAIEIIIVVQKPGTHRTQCDQALDNGKGVTWLDDCRIPYPDGEKSSAGNRTATFGTQETISGGDSSGGWKMCKEGRFPANLLVSDDVLNDGKKPNQGHSPRGKVTGYGNFGGGKQEYHGVGKKFKDKGTYSRFFSLDAWAQRNLPFLIVSKASKKEKNAGLQDREQQTTNDCRKKSIDNPFQRGETLRYNNHPTVKPLKLMAYLTVLGSRKGEIVLDPFCGSGTTCVASMLLDRKFIGIEKDKNYIQIAKKRLLNIPKVKKCDEPGKVIRLSEIESIDLHWSGDTVIDMQAIPSVVDHALENKGRTSSYKGFEIIPTYRAKISDSEKELDETPSQYQKIASGMKKRLGAKRKAKIISASWRTDIPAFYSDWFFNRVKEGLALVKTELDSEIQKVYLTPDDVRCFVFWTKNPGPMLDRLHELDQYKYYFHFTLTPYGRDIEKNLPPKEELIETFIRLSERIGKEKVIWRYDPIILTNNIDIEYHKKHFAYLCEKLHKHTNKCIVGFVNQHQIKKVVRDSMGMKLINVDTKWELASWIQYIAEGHGLKVETCADKIDFSEIGMTPSKCVDGELIGKITGEVLPISTNIPLRKKCRCMKSFDIGTNDTCTHGCRFCYATKNEIQALLNYQQHDSDSPAMTMEMEVDSQKEKDNVQDWADKGINISKGCSNNCLYCYAREESVRRHGNVYENWPNEQLNEKMIKKGWRMSSKRLMLPSTHDITPGTYDACESTLKKLLAAGNPVLVVSKPIPDLIEKLCDSLEPYKDLVMFRFTISARNNDILSFWEPNASSYEDRVNALIIAYAKGFKTSVSIEPMLDPGDIKGLVEDLRDFTTDSMWIGPVKMIRKRTRIDSDEIEKEVQKIEAGQTPEKLLEVYNLYKNDPLIKWKGHFRKLLRKIGVEVPEQKDDWRDRL